MSIKEVTYYQVVCDWPGCGATAHDASDFSAWSDDGAAREEVEWANSDGHDGDTDTDSDDDDGRVTLIGGA